jgi:hypothetical protein
MIKYIPAMVINYIELMDKLKGDIPEFIKEIDDARKQLKQISGYLYDNDICRFSDIFGKEFAFSLYGDTYMENKIFSMSVWDYTGTTLIFHDKIPAENRKEFIGALLHDCEEFSKGRKKCSDCGKWINYRECEINRYFAGVYCNDCWNGKWKSIESKENYE